MRNAAFYVGFLLWTGAASAEIDGLREPADFAGIADATERSVAIFEEMSKVITHPRCINCHPIEGGPRQGDDMRPHVPPIPRWDEGGFGPPGLHCTACHGEEAVAFVGDSGSIPGHGHWHLPPVSMGWIGMTRGEICAQIKDPERNGGRSLEDIHHHHLTDALVLNSWRTHGVGRTPLPGNPEVFAELTRAWIDTGAACPD
jgi:hypothetical protein